MRVMLDLADEGDVIDVIDENGERHPLLYFDPESLGNDPLE